MTRAPVAKKQIQMLPLGCGKIWTRERLLLFFVGVVKYLLIWLLRVLVEASGNFVPPPGIEPRALVLGAWRLSHWTGREVLRLLLLMKHNSGQGSMVASRFLGWAQARVCKIERVHPPTGDPLSPFSEAFS